MPPKAAAAPNMKQLLQGMKKAFQENNMDEVKRIGAYVIEKRIDEASEKEQYQIFLLTGAVHDKLNELVEAEACYERAVAVLPEPPTAWEGLFKLYKQSWPPHLAASLHTKRLNVYRNLQKRWSDQDVGKAGLTALKKAELFVLLGSAEFVEKDSEKAASLWEFSLPLLQESEEKSKSEEASAAAALRLQALCGLASVSHAKANEEWSKEYVRRCEKHIGSYLAECIEKEKSGVTRNPAEEMFHMKDLERRIVAKLTASILDKATARQCLDWYTQLTLLVDHMAGSGQSVSESAVSQDVTPETAYSRAILFSEVQHLQTDTVAGYEQSLALCLGLSSRMLQAFPRSIFAAVRVLEYSILLHGGTDHVAELAKMPVIGQALHCLRSASDPANDASHLAPAHHQLAVVARVAYDAAVGAGDGSFACDENKLMGLLSHASAHGVTIDQVLEWVSPTHVPVFALDVAEEKKSAAEAGVLGRSSASSGPSNEIGVRGFPFASFVPFALEDGQTFTSTTLTGLSIVRVLGASALSGLLAHRRSEEAVVKFMQMWEEHLALLEARACVTQAPEQSKASSSQAALRRCHALLQLARAHLLEKASLAEHRRTARNIYARVLQLCVGGEIGRGIDDAKAQERSVDHIRAAADGDAVTVVVPTSDSPLRDAMLALAPLIKASPSADSERAIRGLVEVCLANSFRDLDLLQRLALARDVSRMAASVWPKRAWPPAAEGWSTAMGARAMVRAGQEAFPVFVKALCGDIGVGLSRVQAQQSCLSGAHAALSVAVQLATESGVAREISLYRTRLGVVMWRQGQKADAFAHFRDAAKIYPTNSDAFAWLGHYYCQVDSKRGAALSCYRKALSLDPANEEAGVGAATLLQTSVPELRAIYSSAVRADPSATWAWKGNGRLSNRPSVAAYTDAVFSFQSALRSDATDASAWEELADVYAQMGKLSAAHKSLERAIALGGLPNASAGRHYQLASVQLRLGHFRDAKESVRSGLQCLDGVPNSSPSRFSFEGPLKLLLSEVHLAEAQSRYSEGCSAAAYMSASQCNDVLSTMGDSKESSLTLSSSARALKTRADALVLMGQTSHAHDQRNADAQQTPPHHDKPLALYDQAVQLYTQAQTAHPNAIWLLYDRAVAHAWAYRTAYSAYWLKHAADGKGKELLDKAAHQLAAAVDTIKECIRQSPVTSAFWILLSQLSSMPLADTSTAAGTPAVSLHYACSALKTADSPTLQAHAWSNLSCVLLCASAQTSQGKSQTMAAARYALQQAQSLDPSQSMVWLCHGLFNSQVLGPLAVEHALGAFEQVDELQSSDVSNASLALCSLLLNQPITAGTASHKANTFAPHSVQSWAVEGTVAEYEGRFAVAEVCYAKAVSLMEGGVTRGSKGDSGEGVGHLADCLCALQLALCRVLACVGKFDAALALASTALPQAITRHAHHTVQLSRALCSLAPSQLLYVSSNIWLAPLLILTRVVALKGQQESSDASGMLSQAHDLVAQIEKTVQAAPLWSVINEPHKETEEAKDSVAVFQTISTIGDACKHFRQAIGAFALAQADPAKPSVEAHLWLGLSQSAKDTTATSFMAAGAFRSPTASIGSERCERSVVSAAQRRVILAPYDPTAWVALQSALTVHGRASTAHHVGLGSSRLAHHGVAQRGSSAVLGHSPLTLTHSSSHPADSLDFQLLRLRVAQESGVGCTTSASAARSVSRLASRVVHNFPAEPQVWARLALCLCANAQYHSSVQQGVCATASALYRTASRLLKAFFAQPPPSYASTDTRSQANYASLLCSCHLAQADMALYKAAETRLGGPKQPNAPMLLEAKAHCDDVVRVLSEAQKGMGVSDLSESDKRSVSAWWTRMKALLSCCQARISVAQGAVDDALQQYRDGLLAAPLQLELWEEMFALLMHVGSHGAALECLDAALSLFKSREADISRDVQRRIRSRLLTRKAHLMYFGKRYKDGAEAAEEAAELAPTSPAALLIHAMFLRRLRKTSAAISTLEAALQVHGGVPTLSIEHTPAPALCNFQLALLFLKSNDYVDAENCLWYEFEQSSAATLVVTYGSLFYHMALCKQAAASDVGNTPDGEEKTGRADDSSSKEAANSPSSLQKEARRLMCRAVMCDPSVTSLWESLQGGQSSKSSKKN